MSDVGATATKQCPLCAETIAAQAVLCKHCGAFATPSGWLPKGSTPTPGGPASGPPPTAAQVPPQYGSGVPAQYGTAAHSTPAGQLEKVGTNGMAIASMVLGIVWVYGIGSILALIFGYLARRQIVAMRLQGKEQAGSGMAMAGIVLGWIGVGGLILFILFVIIGIASTTTVPTYGSLRALSGH